MSLALRNFNFDYYQWWSRGHKARGQGHKKILRPRTDPFEAKDQGHRRKCSQKKSLQKFFSGDLKKKSSKIFSGEKGLQKFFFRRSLLEKTKKKVFTNFLQGFWRFLTKFQRFKNRAEYRAIFKDLRFQGKGQGLQNVSLRTPPLFCSTKL